MYLFLSLCCGVWVHHFLFFAVHIGMQCARTRLAVHVYTIQYHDLYCAFSGLGDSTSVMFCGSFHARAMYLNSLRSTGQRIWTQSGNGWCYSLCMAAPRHELFLLVREADGSVRERLADCYHARVSIIAFYLRRNVSCCSEKSPQKARSIRWEGHGNVHLSHVTSARMISPILPPEAR